MSYCSQERAELLLHTWKKFRRLDARGCWLPVCDAGQKSGSGKRHEDEPTGEGVAQRMGCDGFRNLRNQTGLPALQLNRQVTDVPGNSPGKSQSFGLSTSHQARRISSSLGDNIV